MKLKTSEERIGELFILTEITLYALFPIVATHATKLMPPILFAGLSILVAALPLFLVLLLKKEFKKFLHKKALLYILGVTLFVVILPSIFIYLGTSQSTGINTAILLQIEILFTFLIVGTLTHEKITTQKLLGGGLVVAGALAIIYNGSFQINQGDLLIILGTIFYPFGNICAKKALKLVSPTHILFIRSLLGGTTLILISILFETHETPMLNDLKNHWDLILINGFIIYFLSKMIWYQGLKRLDISKAIPLSMSHPAFSLLYAYLFLSEIPTLYQWIGFFVITLGIFTLTKKNKDPGLVEWE